MGSCAGCVRDRAEAPWPPLRGAARGGGGTGHRAGVAMSRVRARPVPVRRAAETPEPGLLHRWHEDPGSGPGRLPGRPQAAGLGAWPSGQAPGGTQQHQEPGHVDPGPWTAGSAVAVAAAAAVGTMLRRRIATIKQFCLFH